MSFSSVSSKPNDNDDCANTDLVDQTDDEPLDPRIQIELERANAATSEINNLETQLDEAQQQFQNSFSSCKQRLAVLAKQLGSCVERARPFYEACKLAEDAQLETQKAAQEYQRSVEVYRVAKETLSLAESKLLKSDKREFDAAWQEYVNHATMKVMQAEQDKTRSERTHEEKSKLYQECEQQRVALQRSLKRSIVKSKPYFDTKEQAEYELQNQKLRIEAVQKAIVQAKKMYRTALNNLERISEEIHSKRKNHSLVKLPPREPGVGSDKPDEFIELPDLELTEFPKIDLSDEDDDDGVHEDGSKKSTQDDDNISHSISSMSIDGCSMTIPSQLSSSTSSAQQVTSDYESFADCLRQSLPKTFATAPAPSAKLYSSTDFDHRFSIRLNGEGSSIDSTQRRSRKNGISSSTTGGPRINETPLLSHLLGTHQFNSDFNLKSFSSADPI